MEAFEEPGEFPGVGSFASVPPRVWGPWTESKLALHGAYMPSPVLPTQFGLAGPTIVNGGSADITFLPVDLRPHDDIELDLIYVASGSDNGDDIVCEWSATAVNVNGRVEGVFTLKRGVASIDLSALLAFETEAPEPVEPD